MKARSALPAIVALVISVLLLLYNCIVFIYVKHLTQRDFEEQMRLIAGQIRSSVGVARSEFRPASDELDSLLDSYPFLIEITVFDYDVFANVTDAGAVLASGVRTGSGRDPVLYGTYRYANAEFDVRCMQEVMTSGDEIGYIDEIGGRDVYKRFYPALRGDASYIIGLVADREAVQQAFEHPLNRAGGALAAALPVNAGLIMVLFSVTRRSKGRADQEQEAQWRNINDLFTAIRAQHHDFLNQVQTIHAMASMGKTEDLKRFVRELIEDIRDISGLIKIGNPAVASVVQAKIAAAAAKRIDFRHEIADLQDLKLGVRSLDIVKIIGNLVDNAFDEVSELPEDQRKVHLAVYAEEGMLHIRTRNPGRRPDDDEIHRWFEPGYTTRRNGGHSGLGLAITRERTERSRGSISAEYSPEEGIVVHVKLPLE